MPKTKRQYKRYSSEFKREALLRASEEGMTDKAVCDELGISTCQFKQWRDELALLGQEAFPGTGVSRDQEVAALRRDLARVTKERGFLGQAAAYFARRSQ
jgi:transposase